MKNSLIKKSLYCFCLIFGLMVIRVEAQTKVGFSYGYSSSNFKYIPTAGRPAMRTPGISSPTYSFLIEHFVSKSAGARIEIQKLNLGFTQSDTLGRTNQTQLDYLKVPFLANFALGRSLKFHIKIGTHFGYLLKVEDVKREYEGQSLLPSYGREGDNPNRFMYGIIAGVGLSKTWGIHTIGADIRYSYDFNRLEQNNRIFDMNSTNSELAFSYLVRITKPKW
jgi:hypothetical protein